MANTTLKMEQCVFTDGVWTPGLTRVRHLMLTASGTLVITDREGTSHTIEGLIPAEWSIWPATVVESGTTINADNIWAVGE